MQVIWRKIAREELRNVLRYGRENFGMHAIQHFYEQIDRCELLLSSNPSMGHIESSFADRQKVYRSLVVHRHYKFVYWVDETKGVIYIADLWDTRREPATLAGRI